MSLSVSLSGLQAGLAQLDAAAVAPPVDGAVGLITSKAVVEANLAAIRVQDELLGTLLDLRA